MNNSLAVALVRAALLAALCLLVACGDRRRGEDKTAAAPAGGVPTSLALRVALAPHPGEGAGDDSLRVAQNAVRERADLPRLERLATLFIGKARTSGDPGFYKQAEACADAMPFAADGSGHAANLVRGHVRHALHDFVAAERIARELVAARGLFLDHGLLGDVLLDRGQLEEARSVYQRMLDLKPCLQRYARAAQVRWMVGDLAGCRELLGLAASAGSKRDPESMAWVLARRAVLELQANDVIAAKQCADQALGLVPGYPAALVARGRAAMAAGKHGDAAIDLAAAAAAYPLPEYLWAHADALTAAGRAELAEGVRVELQRTGEREDPRTFVVWLATVGREPAMALRLAEAELALRHDAHTLDALAIARWRCGDVLGAAQAIERALADGVHDARLFLHAALIAHAAGDVAAAMRHADAARAQAAALLPSELTALADLPRRS